MKLFVAVISAFVIALLIATDCSAKQQPQFLMSLGGILHSVTETVERAVKVVEPVTSKLPEVAAPIKETVETAVKVVEPVTSKLPEAAAPLKETVETAVKVVEPVTSKLPEVAAPIQELVQTAVKAVEPAVDTLVETVAPITDMVESTKGVIKPAVDTLVETIAPVTDTVESTWKALQLTVNKPVEPAAPTKEPIQPFVQPQPEKPTKDEREAVKNESAAAERGKETPLSLQPLFTPPSLAAVEEPPPAIEPEPPLPSDVADNPSATPTSPETPLSAQFETKVPQRHTLITNPAVIAQDEPPVLIRPELEVPETITPTANDSTALRPQRQGITSPEVATPVVELPVRSSRKIDEHKPLNEPNPGSPYTDIPAAVIQGTQSCPNYSKITGSASSAFIAGILNDHVHSSLQCRILLWVRSIELYKKWSNAPPGHPPKFSFSRVL